LNARQRAHFRKILEALKAELSEEIDRTVHTMQDEATVFADPNDRASQESDMALELRNRDRERKLIKRSTRPSRASTPTSTATARAAASRLVSSGSRARPPRPCASTARRSTSCASARSRSKKT